MNIKKKSIEATDESIQATHEGSVQGLERGKGSGFRVNIKKKSIEATDESTQATHEGSGFRAREGFRV